MPEPMIDIPIDPPATCDRCGSSHVSFRCGQCSFVLCDPCLARHQIDRSLVRGRGGFSFCDRVIEAAWTHAVFRITDEELRRYGRDLTGIEDVVLAMLTDADWDFARREYAADLWVGPRC